MSIESKLRAYIGLLDGTPKTFTSVEHHFEDLYHSEFVLQESEQTVDRGQMKLVQSKAFELGSKATLLHCSASASMIEYNFCLSNKQWAMIICCIAEIKDNKLYRAKPVKGSKPLLLTNFEAYMAAFDGTIKDFSQVSHMFEDLYDDAFVYQADGKPVDKKY